VRYSFYLMAHGVVPLAAVLWIGGATVAVVRGRSDAPPANAALTLFAIPALLAAWSVLALLFKLRGPWFVLSLLALVWLADISAYFAGKAFGRRKLAPRVSPGKTIEGALAGVAAAVIWIGISSFWPGSFGHALVVRWTLWGALPIGALLGVLSIVGDLFESLLKRRAGRKDSSALLPGHGGVYDRIDAVLPVAPVAFILCGVLF
jgi:phosphatidate cytidylyltransferase